MKRSCPLILQTECLAHARESFPSASLVESELGTSDEPCLDLDCPMHSVGFESRGITRPGSPSPVCRSFIRGDCPGGNPTRHVAGPQNLKACVFVNAGRGPTTSAWGGSVLWFISSDFAVYPRLSSVQAKWRAWGWRK
eukprot:514720-Rhodomonas_salina.1